MELTPWFKPPHKPVRSGIYQVRGVAPDQVWWCWWDVKARAWGLISGTQEGAVAWRATPSGRQERIWRGVTA